MKRIFWSLLTVCMLAAVMTVGTLAAVDTWDGTADTSWYNETDTEFTITTSEELAGLSVLVDGGNTFEGKTILLGNDIDLYLDNGEGSEPVSFDPIGDKSAFAGTFDGDGYTISNLYQSGWAFGYEWGSYGSIGLFGELKDATVKNLTIKGAESFVEGGDVGGIAGSASGICTFENIMIVDSVFATYNNGLGGIVGWSGAGEYTFKNINIGADVTLAGLWGSFDSSIGGVVGQAEPGATYDFDDVIIACRLDAYNDCTASYDYYNYRMCGMIIGRLEETTQIDGKNYPDLSKYNIICNNVTVVYGDWHNYHYCDPTPGYNGGRGMRVESGYTYDGLPADYDHTQCTSHCKELISFNQLFGGKQYAAGGQPTHEDVVVYGAEDDNGYNQKYNNISHWYENANGEKILTESHTYTAWNVTEQPVASQTGSRERECIVCGYKDVETLAKTGTGIFYQSLRMLFSQSYEIDVDMTLRNEDGIITTATEGGTVTPKSGTNTVLYDRSITYTITPDEGYRIADVLYNGESVGAVTEYTAKRVKADGVLEVVFEMIPVEEETTEEPTPAEETEVA